MRAIRRGDAVWVDYGPSGVQLAVFVEPSRRTVQTFAMASGEWGTVRAIVPKDVAVFPPRGARRILAAAGVPPSRCYPLEDARAWLRATSSDRRPPSTRRGARRRRRR